MLLPRQDAAVIVFARSPERDALRWGWAGVAGVAARRKLVESLPDRLAPLRGADLLVFHDGDPGPLLAAPGIRAFVPQAGRTFGDRLHHALAHAFAQGYRRVVVVGTDSPGLTHRHVARSLRQLAHTPLVIGADSTGGSYLLALTPGVLPQLRTIPWGTGQDVHALRCAVPGARELPQVVDDLDAVQTSARLTEVLSRAICRLLALLSAVFARVQPVLAAVGRVLPPHPSDALPDALLSTGPPLARCPQFR